MAGDTLGFGPAFLFCLPRVGSVSQVLCPEMEKLDFVLFTKLEVSIFLLLEHFPLNLHEPPTLHPLNDLDRDSNDIKLELPLLNSQGDMARGFRDFTPTFWLNARLAGPTPRWARQYQCPSSPRMRSSSLWLDSGHFCFLSLYTMVKLEKGAYSLQLFPL